MYVISLSTIPSRFRFLGPALESLLRQEVRPEAIRLYIPKRYRRFPDWDGTLPEVPRGIEIRRPEDDLGPASKVLFAADELRGQDLHILYCDDDRFYLPDWSTRLLAGAQARPGAAIATVGSELERIGLERPRDRPQPRAAMSRRKPLGYRLARFLQDVAHGGRSRVPHEKRVPRNRIRRSGYLDLASGHGGVLVRPDWLGREAWDIPPIMWAVDDIWLSGQLARRGVPIWGEAGASRFRVMPAQQVDALYQAVIDGTVRRDANRACAIYMRDTFGIWGGPSGSAPDGSPIETSTPSRRGT